MSVVIAALDSTAVAPAVLGTAGRVADLMGAKVEAVHVRDGGGATPRALASRADVPFRLLDGPEGPALVAVLSKPSVWAGVIGARSTPDGPQPVGHAAQHVLSHTDKALVVVPPETIDARPLHRILVPLDGADSCAALVVDHVQSLFGAATDVIVLHVFTQATLPAMVDRPEYDFHILGREFLARHLPGANHIELRPGPVGRRVLEVCEETDADLVVLSWDQTLSEGRARVVNDVLRSSEIPVLLLPMANVKAATTGELVTTGAA